MTEKTAKEQRIIDAALVRKLADGPDWKRYGMGVLALREAALVIEKQRLLTAEEKIAITK